MTLLYLQFFQFIFLFIFTFSVSGIFSYFTEPQTESRFRGFKTLWKPYTRLYTVVHLHQSSDYVATPTLKTTYITVDGDLRTPIFLSDYYYDDRPLGTVKKQLILREMLVNVCTKNHGHFTQRYQLLGGKDSEELPDLSTTATTTTTTKTKTIKKQPWMSKSIVVAYCYVCGLKEPGIQNANCYNAFDNPDRIFPKNRHKNKAKRYCMHGTKQHTNRIWYGKLYKQGCFNRFTDVGFVYNERGCRTKKPYMGSSFASKRFAKLEKQLHRVDNGCVFSPYAVLTPFSRAVSLYVRYHVCVCQGKYCNRATSIANIRICLIAIILSWLFLF